jgi:hypothetical protein
MTKRKKEIVYRFQKRLINSKLNSYEDNEYRQLLPNATRHPTNFQLKRKTLFATMAIPMFGELKRGAVARAMRIDKILFAFTGTYFDISMPISISANIEEMIIPCKTVKVAYRYIKNSGSASLFACSVFIHNYT